MESVRGCLGSYEPSINLLPNFVPLVGWDFKARCEKLVSIFIVFHIAPSVLSVICVIPELSTDSIRSNKSRRISIRGCRLGLYLARDWFLLVVGYCAVDTVDCNSDIVAVEAVTMDGQVLMSTGVANVGTDVKDHRNAQSFVASGVVVRAMEWLCFRDHCIADFPKHLDVIFAANWHLSNKTLHAIIGPPRERGLVVDNTFEVKFGSADFGVHKKHLIRFKILHDSLSVFGIKPKLSKRIIVDYRRW